MAAVAAAAQSVLTGGIAVGSSSSVFTASNNVASGASNSAAGLRLFPVRRVRRGRTGGVQRRPQRCYQGPSALFDPRSDGSDTKKDEKKFISRDEEPEQYWMTPDEKEGKNPMSTPLPWIVMLSVLSPFVILAVAFANNWIKTPLR